MLAPAAFELVDRLQTAPSIGVAWSDYMSAARKAGLSFGAASFFAPGMTVSDAVFADSMPQGWLAHYAREGHQHHSPMMRRSYDNATFAWRMTDWDGTLDRRQRLWREDNLGAGIAHGVSIPERQNGEVKIITLCGSNDNDRPERRDLLVLKFAAVELFARLRDLGVRPPTIPGAPLTERQTECLTWAAIGKTDWEIGEILALSHKTVNHHIESAKLKLHATTRIHAVVLALRGGMIHI